MKIVKDKVFERLTKLEKAKTSYQIHFIGNRHVDSIKLSIQAVTETQCNGWTPLHQNLKPLNHPKTTTNLSKLSIQCKECNVYNINSYTRVYIHKYTYTCPDSPQCNNV